MNAAIYPIGFRLLPFTLRPSLFWLCAFSIIFNAVGPPGQMKAISGMKAGMKQGELAGALKEAAFTAEQVSFRYIFPFSFPSTINYSSSVNFHIVRSGANARLGV
jgi:hypothetical protein